MKYARIIPVFILAACDETIAPCERACVEGYDVAIAAVAVQPTAGRDPAGLAIVAKGSIPVDVVLYNNGRNASPAATLDLSTSNGANLDGIPVASIASGDSLHVRAEMQSTEPDIIYAFDDTRNDVLSVNARLTIAADADTSNHVSRSADFHYAVPVLRIIMGATDPKIRINEPFTVSFTAQNRSAYVASAPVRLRFCLWDYDSGCLPGNWSLFGNVIVPSVPPSGVISFSVTTAVTAGAIIHDEAYTRWLGACVVSETWQDEYMPYSPLERGPCGIGSPGPVLVRPDYENTCAIPNATAGTPVVFTTHNCGRMPPTSQVRNPPFNMSRYLFHIVSLDVVAGRRYTVTRANSSGGVQVFNAEGDTAYDLGTPPGYVFKESGRYYLVFYTNTPQQTITVTS